MSQTEIRLSYQSAFHRLPPIVPSHSPLTPPTPLSLSIHTAKTLAINMLLH